MSSIEDGSQRFGFVLAALEAEIDWLRLGSMYCHEGGESFFSPSQLEAQGMAGLHIAAALAEALEEAGTAPRGRSLYVGAALAELPPALCEALILEREVELVTLPGPEPDELNRALTVVEAELDHPLPRLRTCGLADLEGEFDHGWLVSVLTDPDAFPALHDCLYGRTGADATGKGDADAEVRAARRLVEELAARLRPPALFTTTDEELAIVTEVCHARGWRLEVPTEGRLTAIVGDVLRHCRVLSGG